MPTWLEGLLTIAFIVSVIMLGGQVFRTIFSVCSDSPSRTLVDTCYFFGCLYLTLTLAIVLFHFAPIK